MAKKKSKKMDVLALVLTIVVIALAVLTICTLFMPVFISKSSAFGGAIANETHIKGSDVITACFKGETSSDLSYGANALISLKGSDDAGFVTGLFCWMYFLAVIVSVGVVVFALLKVFGFKFKLVNVIFGIALVVLALVAFICSFVVAGKFGSVGLGALASGKTVVAVGSYLLLTTIACGGMNAYLARK